MNEELIKRIDEQLSLWVIGIIDENNIADCLRDCRAALSRKYVPMTEDDFMRVDISTGMQDPKCAWAYERNIESAVIRRAGLEVQE